MPDLVRQPGFIRAEVYESLCVGHFNFVRGHWVTLINWEDGQSRSEAAEHFAELYKEFERYERFSPEIPMLVSRSRE